MPTEVLLPWRQRVAAFVAALLYAICLLGLGGATPDALYGHHPEHRLQTAALLDGQFHVSDSLYAVRFDNAFYEGKVQQVWGLGAGIWLMPFELLGRMIGLTPFPDRGAMGGAFLLFAYYTLATALKFACSGLPPFTATAMVYLFLLAPPLWTLMVKGPQTVYEDTSIYALIVSLAILIAVIRVVAFSDWRDYWLGCGLAALSGLVRPTHAIYGIVGVSLCFRILFLRKAARSQLIAGAALMLAGMVFLAVSNQVRFGSPFEFGHRLTATTVEGILTSRFVNPIENASVWAAAKELFGALFLSLSDIREKGDWDAELFPGQTPFIRWRNWYVTTYDPSLAAILLLGGIVAVACWFKRCGWGFGIGAWLGRSNVTCKIVGQTACLPVAGASLPRHSDGRTPSELADRMSAPPCALILTLAAWTLLTVPPIYAFMLYYAGLCARYLYDFWPGFAGLMVVALFGLSKPKPSLVSLLFIGWLGVQLWRADCRWPRQLPVSRAEAAVQAERGDVALDAFHGCFTPEHHPSDLVQTGRPFVTAGWENGSGSARFAVMVPVDRPQFVELRVSPRLQTAGDAGRSDVYRARIGNLELPLAGAEPDTDGKSLRVRFDVPERIRRRAGDELLFLCFVAVGDWEDWGSRRILHSIRWR